MKRLLYLLCAIVALTACMSSPLESKSPQEQFNDLPKKSDLPPAFKAGADFIPLPERDSIIEVAGWFDESTVLYLTEKNKMNALYKHHLQTGEKQLFFEVEGQIVDVAANEDNSLFAIQIMNEANETDLLVVDREGSKKMNFEGFGDNYSVYWNPYEKAQFVLVAYLPDWNVDVFFVDAAIEKMTQLDMNQTYFQWVSPTAIAYTKGVEESYHAPLYEYDIKTGQEKGGQEEVITFIGFPNHISLTVTAESEYEMNTDYAFYKEATRIHQFQMPILNTYSAQWWVPFSTFDSEHDTFYFLRPHYSSDFISYEDGYEVVAFNLEDGSEKVLTELQEQVPITISPSGEYLLIGNRFERVFDLKSEQLETLWQMD